MIRLLVTCVVVALVFGVDALEMIALWLLVCAVLLLAYIADKLRTPGPLARWWERHKLEQQYRLEQERER